MFRLYLLLFLFFSVPSQAVDWHRPLSLSQTSVLSLPKEWNMIGVPLSSMRGLLFQGIPEGNRAKIYVYHLKPENLANTVTVNRYWKNFIKEETRQGRVTQNSSCKRIQGLKFHCQRVAKEGKKKFYADSLFFNELKDLVLVRVEGFHSADHSNQVLEKIKVELE